MMSAILRLPRHLPKAGLCCLLVTALFCLAFWQRQQPQALTDLRFRRSDCGGGQRDLHSVCRCPRSGQPLLVPAHQRMSACSDHASVRGPGQRVVAYSFYGSVDSRYFVGAEANVAAVAHLYPGWVMRLYTNISLDDPREVAVLCRIWCSSPHLDVCHAQQLPAPLCDQSEVFGMIWRFFVMGDSLVDRFILRDMDSEIYQREVDAVQEWVKRGRTWHSMRDSIYHDFPMLGGMWGGRNLDLNATIKLRNEMISRGKLWMKGYDQNLLTEIVWPYARQDMLQHDSYFCQKFKQSEPWPTKRIGVLFVGSDFPWEGGGRHTKTECPASCRPKEHPDWTYC